MDNMDDVGRMDIVALLPGPVHSVHAVHDAHVGGRVLDLPDRSPAATMPPAAVSE
jgi:hypothetical protein